jgi:hypothetical protein
VDFRQLTVHPVHPIGGEQRRHAQRFGYGGLDLGLSSTDWNGQLLGIGMSGGEVHHQDPLCLERKLMPRRCFWLDRGSGLLAGEVASS